MRKKLFTFLLALVTSVGLSYADPVGLQVTELEVPGSWEDNPTMLSTSDMPGFVAITEAEAQAWDAAPAGNVVLIFAFEGNGATSLSFKDGVYQASQAHNITYEDLYGWSVLGRQIFYTGGGSTPSGDGDKLSGAFSVSVTKVVYFSQGNLQYTKSTGKWKIMDHQYDVVETLSQNVGTDYASQDVITLFGWGTSGWDNTAADATSVHYQPYSTCKTIHNSKANINNYQYGPSNANVVGSSNTASAESWSKSDSYKNYDWGVFNSGDLGSGWRVLTTEEWGYLLGSTSPARTNAANLRTLATVNSVPGLIIMPDGWTASGVSLTVTTSKYTTNNINLTNWSTLEEQGCVFLPAASYRDGTRVYDDKTRGFYWSSSAYSANFAYGLDFYSGSVGPQAINGRYDGCSVRLVSETAPTPAPANSCGDGLTWELNAGVFTISYDGVGTGVMDDFDYSEHPAPWQSSKESITSVIIPDGVTRIGNNAFSGAYNLASVSMGDDVVAIGNNAFEACNSLSSITLSSHVTTIGDHAFAGLQSLTSIVLPSTVQSIGMSAFYGNEGLTSITCEGTTPPTLGQYVFGMIGNGATLYVPYGYAETYESADSQWQALNIQVIGSGSASYPYCGDGLTWTYNDGVLTIIYDGVGTGDMLDYGNYNIVPWDSYKDDITSVIIPDGVIRIGSYAFANLTNLASVSMGDDVVEIGYGGFWNCLSLQSITLGSHVTTIGEHAFGSNQALTSITLPNTLQTIGGSAFYNCNSLPTITIPSSVTSFGEYAFGFCEGLTSFTCEGTTPPTLGQDVFTMVPYHRPLYVPDGYVETYQGADSQWQKFDISIIPGGDPTPDPEPTPSATGVIFANCYDCWRSPDYPKISGQCYLHSFADPRVGNNKPSGPWKLEFVENYNSSSAEYDSDIVKNAVASEYYKSPAEMEVYRLYQWQNGAYQPVAYGVLYAYANENNQVEHAAFFEADGFWGCYLTDNTHSNGDNINILFNEDASTGFADLHGGSTNPEIKLYANFSGDWADTEAFTDNGDGTATLTIPSLEARHNAIFVKKDGVEMSSGHNFTRENPSANVSGNQLAMWFDTDEAGEYTFTFEYSTNILTITYPTATPTPTPSDDANKLPGAFSVSGTKVVYFSKGNLQATTADNGNTWTWGFAENQYDVIGDAVANKAINGGGAVSSNGAVDLFGWSSNANNYYGINNSMSVDDYSGNFQDWGAKVGSDWRTLNGAQWEYLLLTREPGSLADGTSNPRFTRATILTDGTAPSQDIFGLILFPDNFNDGGEYIDGVTWNGINSYSSYVSPTSCTTAGWATLESMGCVFLPAPGWRSGNEVTNAGAFGIYWSSSKYSEEDASCIYFSNTDVAASHSYITTGASVRLVSETAPSGGGSSTPEIKLNANFGGPDNWADTEAFTDNGNGTATLSNIALEAGYYYNFRVKVDGVSMSDNHEFTRQNPSYVISSGSGDVYYFQADVTGNYSFTWEYATNTLTIGYPEIQHTYTAVGHNLAIFSNSWDPSITDNDLVLQEDGSYKWEKENVSFTGATTIQYRVCKDHAWDVAYPATSEQPATFEIPSLGDYKITITYNPVGNVISASAEKIAKPTIQLNGNFSGEWADTEEFEVVEQPMDSYAKLTKLLEPGTYEFGVKVNGEWRANGSAYTRDNYSYIIEEGHTGNLTINVDVKGYYSFFWYYDNNRLIIDYSRVCGMYWKDVTAGNFEVTLGQEGEVTLPKVWATSMAFVSNIANGVDQVRLGSTDETVATIAYTLSEDGLGTLTFHQAGECDIYVVHDITNLYCYDSCAFHLTVHPAAPVVPVYTDADFAIDFRTDPYTKVGGGDLPAGVLVEGSMNTSDAAHGYRLPVITIPVTAGNYKVMMGTCTFSNQDATIKTEDNSYTYATLETNNGTCYHQNTATNVVGAIFNVPSDQIIKVYGAEYTPFFSIEKMEAVPAFTDFEINFRTDPYDMISGAKPEGTVIAGSYHDNLHGYQNVEAVVPVEAGNYRLTVGACQYGTPGNVMSETNAELASFNSNLGEGNCYHNNTAANIVSTIFTVDMNQTITINGGAYMPYMKLEKLLDNTYYINFENAEGAIGTVPGEVAIAAGESWTIPANLTLYKEGYTFVGWSDGVNTYAPGDEFFPSAHGTLQAVYTANSVSIADASTINVKWYFGESNGAPSVTWNGVAGYLLAKGEVDGELIDLKLDIDATSGKFDNNGRDDKWAQVNANTAFTFPSKEGAVVNVETYSGNETYDLAAGTLTCNTNDYYSYLEIVYPAPTTAVEIGDPNDADQVTAFLNTYDGHTIDELIIDRPVLNNMYNTLCLPFDMNATQIAASSLNGVEIREFTGASVEGTTLNLSVGDPVNAVVAGRPYFVKYSAASQLDNLHFEDVTINNALLDNMAVTFDGVTFKGTFTPFVMPNGLNFQGGYLFLGQNNQLFWPNTNNPLKPFRAYFYVDVESSTPGNAPKYRGMPARIVEGKNVATGVENAQSANQSTKVIVNGQLIIIKNDVRYNAQGQIVK